MPVLPKWAGTGIFIYLDYRNQVILNLFQDLKSENDIWLQRV